MRLAPNATLFNVGCPFLATSAWHSFSRLGTSLNQKRGEIMGMFEQFKHFLGRFRENIVMLSNSCD